MNIVIAAALMLLVAGCEQAPPPVAERRSQAPVTRHAAPTYRLDPQFNSLAIELINDDVHSFLRGEEALIGEDIITAVAPDVAELYGAEEAAGDRRYLGKKVFLAGAIGAIHNDVGELPYVVFRGTGPHGVRALLSLEGTSEATELTKVQHTALVCLGAGLIEGTPMFKDCLPAGRYASAEGAKLARSLDAFADGEEIARSVAFLAVHIESKARTIDDADQCAAACLKLANEERAQEPLTLAALVQKMRDGGLQIPTPRKQPPKT